MQVDLSIFPVINASLNGAAAVLIGTGVYFIKTNRREIHRKFMIAAVSCSALFLVCYLTYHGLLGAQSGSVRKHFAGPPLARDVYFTILTSHTILAVVIVPLVLITLSRGLKARYVQHRAIARWTYPLWMYVSVTGVVIYLMLYKIYV
ncbi:protein of unknown function DUF420 [Candidatus Koribacter versatilis Ellin345]|uniref:DUF420 domain-containing protein n=1 Tax=Koribacter versatilis (strain Ellin345) TaxID=204669 RepID=Q1IPH7_KORVE|nr:DUF420 domain-containing protein [Candidatus Koribacter versatilis]ABF41223.1 protein of unknown function DUF420 [Candidatus Koribacter versatilis Ellin345]